MTQDKRIVLNVIATYGRSLLSLVLGLFSSRWVLLSLGEVDFGLYGLIGGLTLFVSLINNVLASAVGRFYAVAVGEAKKRGELQSGVEECRKWFNSAVSVHIIVPVMLVCLGYPLGKWVIVNCLTIPSDRLCACLWVWVFTCMSCLVNMMSVPYVAMYTAKQNIAEMTLFSTLHVVLNFMFVYYMICHPNEEWLAKYAAGICILNFMYMLVLCIRAAVVYPECRLRVRYMIPSSRLKNIAAFACYRMFAETSNIVSSQGIAIATNKFWGPSGNASIQIGRSVSSHTNTLCSAINGAFLPVLANLAGMGETQKIIKYCYRVCKVGTLLYLLFAIPVALEADEILLLWLKKPPESTSSICLIFLLMVLFDQISSGHWMSIYAIGDIKKYQMVTSLSSWLGLIVGIIAFMMGFRILAIGVFGIIQGVCCVVVRLWFGRRVVKVSVKKWIKRVFVPVMFVCIVCGLAGAVPRYYLGPSFLRVCVTAAASLLTFAPVAWCLALDAEEKEYLQGKVWAIRSRFLHVR